MPQKLAQNCHIKKRSAYKTRRKVVKMNTPRMRTLPEAAAELKRMDNDTAITLTALRRMVKTGELPYISVASKRLINFDRLLELLENPNKVDTPCQNAPVVGYLGRR